MNSLPVPLHSSHDEELPLYKLILRCAVFTAVFCVISSVFVLILSAVFYNTSNPTGKTELAGTVALYLAVAVTSFIMTRINKQKWLIGGLLLGAMMAVLTLLISFFVNGEASPSSVICRLLIPIASLAAAFIGRKREEKAKHRRKHRKYS